MNRGSIKRCGICLNSFFIDLSRSAIGQDNLVTPIILDYVIQRRKIYNENIVINITILRKTPDINNWRFTNKDYLIQSNT